MYFAFLPASRSSLRRIEMLFVRPPSSTVVDGQRRSMISPFVTNSPRRSTRNNSRSKTIGCSRTCSSPRQNRRSVGSKRKGPNSYNSLSGLLMRHQEKIQRFLLDVSEDMQRPYALPSGFTWRVEELERNACILSLG